MDAEPVLRRKWVEATAIGSRRLRPRGKALTETRMVRGTHSWMYRNLQVLTARFVPDDWKRLMQLLAGEFETPP